MATVYLASRILGKNRKTIRCVTYLTGLLWILESQSQWLHAEAELGWAGH